MGRGSKSGTLSNHLRTLRAAAGLSQDDVARRSGLTRQAVNTIEAGRYVPNTAVALAIARALGCRVEDLFQLAPSDHIVSVPESALSKRGSRLIAGRVGERVVPWILRGESALLEGFRPADGTISRASSAQVATPSNLIDQTAFLVGCDPSLGILADHVNRHTRDSRLVWIPGSSKAGLNALTTGRAHVAGIHLRDKRSGEYNLASASNTLRAGGTVVAYASWEQGFMVRRAQDRVDDIDALASRGLRLINREAGSGSRVLLDQLAASSGTEVTNIAGYGDTVGSHMAVGRRIAERNADVGIGMLAVADAFDLHFVPLAAARFDLLIPEIHLAHPAIAVLMDVLQGAGLRSALAALPGYDVQGLGSVRKRFSKAA